MRGSTHISTWVTAETKQRFVALAEQLGFSESALLKRLVELNLQSTELAAGSCLGSPAKPAPRDQRLYVRLRSDDHRLLAERSGRRGMAPATYASLLLRTHLRACPPLPDRELAELKRVVAGLGAIGRSLNQIARAANQSGRGEAPAQGDWRVLLRVCEALREHVKTLIKTNASSWETGHE